MLIGKYPNDTLNLYVVWQENAGSLPAGKETRIMKKQIKRTGTIILCVLACTVMLNGCSGEKEAKVEKKSSAVVEKSNVKSGEDAKWSEQYDMQEIEVVNNDQFSLKVVGAGLDTDENFAMEVVVENKTDSFIRVTFLDEYVCGYQIYDYDFWNPEVPAGETDESTIRFAADDLKRCGITSVDEVEFLLDVDGDALGDVDSQNYTIYPTGKTADTVEYPEPPRTEDYIELINDDKFTLALVEIEEREGQGSYLHFYLDNKTENSQFYSVENMTINGKQFIQSIGEIMHANRRLIICNGGGDSTVGINTADDIDEITCTFSSYDNSEEYIQEIDWKHP